MKWIILSVIIFLSACGGGAQQSGLTPMPDVQKLGTDEVKAAVNGYLQTEKAPIQSEYDFTFVDLNNDQRHDALILMKLPHHYWCSWSGCPLLVLENKGSYFDVLSRTENIRGPLFVDNEASNNWKNIIARTSGSNTKDRTVKLSYNRNSYDKNSLDAPTYDQILNTMAMQKAF
ncbi:MAG: hypothetical protein AAF988_06475 [Pseudomonadota bacterium]